MKKRKKCDLLVFYIVNISYDSNLQDISDNLTREYAKNQIFFVVGYEMGIWLGLQLNLH